MRQSAVQHSITEHIRADRTRTEEGGGRRRIQSDVVPIYIKRFLKINVDMTLYELIKSNPKPLEESNKKRKNKIKLR
ncbi:hypothetical protein POVWA2_047510 [Plasmodium ovale wallikeri]|uniref:Uncharacterized protein n=1 Tax=Plasmodium ovale wallikeri TaxID=864142 RepID=A0A1A8ZIM3_PLAOA|nr:hypothetical protein POVWA1_048450 [Plasmodium ovale wallikeri]SBT44254.1 hypothetical protein POVWA2_047510 [Plasmodium ovale wallikeri]